MSTALFLETKRYDDTAQLWMLQGRETLQVRSIKRMATCSTKVRNAIFSGKISWCNHPLKQQGWLVLRSWLGHLSIRERKQFMYNCATNLTLVEYDWCWQILFMYSISWCSFRCPREVIQNGHSSSNTAHKFQSQLATLHCSFPPYLFCACQHAMWTRNLGETWEYAASCISTILWSKSIAKTSRIAANVGFREQLSKYEKACSMLSCKPLLKGCNGRWRIRHISRILIATNGVFFKPICIVPIFTNENMLICPVDFGYVHASIDTCVHSGQKNDVEMTIW